MNSEKFVAILEDLKKIKWKCPSLLNLGVILQHNNATPHRSKTTIAKIVALGWSVFLYPTNSPNLVTLDYHLFPKLEQFLGNKRFLNEEELNAMVLKWF